ncbi:MAG: AraC family transcriptional regulator [Victivallales bacterium]
MERYFRKAFYRVKFQGEDAPLPFSVRSAGHYRLAVGQDESHCGRHFAEFFWVSNGKGKVEFDGREYSFAENQAFYYLSGEEHVLSVLEAPWDYRWFTFDGPLADAVMQGFRYPREPFYAGNCPEELFDSLERRIHDSTIIEMRNLTAVAWQILALAGSGVDAGEKGEKILRTFFDLVRDNYANETININVIADILKIHRSTLTRLVREHTGMTPGNYLYDFRLQKALDMLRSTDMPVGEIAVSCGIPDPCYFSRVIHRAVKCSPLAYRGLYS